MLSCVGKEYVVLDGFNNQYWNILVLELWLLFLNIISYKKYLYPLSEYDNLQKLILLSHLFPVFFAASLSVYDHFKDICSQATGIVLLI